MVQLEVDRKLEAAADESAPLDRVVGRSSYRTLLGDLHSQSRYLLHTKYKYIRWSYGCFLLAVVAAALTELGLRIAG